MVTNLHGAPYLFFDVTRISTWVPSYTTKIDWIVIIIIIIIIRKRGSSVSLLLKSFSLKQPFSNTLSDQLCKYTTKPTTHPWSIYARFVCCSIFSNVLYQINSRFIILLLMLIFIDAQDLHKCVMPSFFLWTQHKLQIIVCVVWTEAERKYRGTLQLQRERIKCVFLLQWDKRAKWIKKYLEEKAKENK